MVHVIIFPTLRVLYFCYWYLFCYLFHTLCSSIVRSLYFINYIIIIIIIIIIVEFLTSQLWLWNIHLSWDAAINRIRLGGLICSLNSFLQFSTYQDLQNFCSCIYVLGCKLSLVRLCDSDFGITSVDDITIGIIVIIIGGGSFVGVGGNYFSVVISNNNNNNNNSGNGRLSCVGPFFEYRMATRNFF